MPKGNILITGTRKGIGNQLANYYLKKNYNVIGCSRGDIDFIHDNYFHFNTDISNEQSVKDMFLRFRKKFKRLDILINNAGVASMNHTLLTPMNKAQKIINTNFLGTFIMSRESAKIMKKYSFGRIINITSVGTQMKLEGEAIYTASKSAVENFTVVLSRELADFGITVNGVGPTPIITDLIKSVPKEKIKNILSQLAFNRFTEITDITNVIDFFISEQSSYITGQVIYLGGG